MPKAVANNGSQLRDHQANERTYLSWTRMGLAFAAMALALGRLDIIENMLNPHSDMGVLAGSAQGTRQLPESKSSSPAQSSFPQTSGATSAPRKAHDLVASRLCQVISVWSLGYGIFRYLSVRRNLLQARFVPAIWGPVFMTCGTLVVFGTITHVDWNLPAFPFQMEKQKSKEERTG